MSRSYLKDELLGYFYDALALFNGKLDTDISNDNLTEFDAVVEGRKNNAVVYFDGEVEHPPIHEGDKLPFSVLEKADKAKKSSLLPILHRQLSPR